MALLKQVSEYTSTFRGDDLTKIRDLIILMDQYNIRSRKVLREYAIKERIFTTKINRLGRYAGEIYQKSGKYHYESPLFSLRIVNKELRDDRISFTSGAFSIDVRHNIFMIFFVLILPLQPISRQVHRC